MKPYQSHTQIATDIEASLKERNLTLRECVDLYNKTYAKEIGSLLKLPLNKDFIQRVKSGRCKVVSLRMVDLCEFLRVDPYEKPSTEVAIQELRNIENLIRQHPILASSLITLMQDVSNLIKLNLGSGVSGKAI